MVDLGRADREKADFGMTDLGRMYLRERSRKANLESVDHGRRIEEGRI